MACRLARARIELQLKAQLDVVSERTALVIIEGVVEYGEDSLRGNRVGRVGQHGAEHVREGRHLVLIGAPEAEQREGVGPVCV
jgi:redox-sensitive bicupin YhaK (pirin superfamily)